MNSGNNNSQNANFNMEVNDRNLKKMEQQEQYRNYLNTQVRKLNLNFKFFYKYQIKEKNNRTPLDNTLNQVTSTNSRILLKKDNKVSLNPCKKLIIK